MIDILSGKVLMNILRSLKRDERMVNITVFYDLNEVEKVLQITTKEKAKEIIAKDLLNIFGYYEGCCGMNV